MSQKNQIVTIGGAKLSKKQQKAAKQEEKQKLAPKKPEKK